MRNEGEANLKDDQQGHGRAGSVEGEGELGTLTLKQKVARRVERGHLWVFSNEVEELRGGAGDEVAVIDGRGRFVGMGVLSNSSLIRARIYARQRGVRLDQAFLQRKIAAARAARAVAFGGLPDSFRLLHSEADGVPGLVADVFGDCVVFQIATAAMEARREIIAAALWDGALGEGGRARVVVERSDVPARRLEGLEPRKAILGGELANPLPVRERGLTLFADILEGQKTGYYLDLATARGEAAPFLTGRRVLDVCCYVGAWSLTALAAGATATVGVDSSGPALALARRSAAENGYGESAKFVEADAFEYLRAAVNRTERYGAIVLDPPPLAKSKKDVPNALRAYRELNLRAMQALEPGGALFTFSCSHAIGEEEFREMLTMAARDVRQDFSFVRPLTQGPDHPMHLQTPETGYLKGALLVKQER